ncbi:MAG: DUF3240 family protein [Methylococcaceae bacterium]|jgi:hypothetical protein|nr:DUF3240 family protein [Methylococcaceae bacterium]MDP2393010.1 DUF3240 family protein [Methylococcaceae bacterium]MDP3020494.1 DUF3240 family protein [Methylococcaceae bacterium]MDP3389857.1 DUF3240 family protein [Methylococcaceae bacterium]MDP3933481.1 DUF3240 family protein [Methylococcaceae bacterium]
MNDKKYLVTINVPPSLEEAVVDCLLTLESEFGFSTFQVNAHDHKNENLSLAEQVTGRQKKIRFQMYLAEEGLAELLTQLKNDFTDSGIHYWVMPVLENGIL